MRSHICEEVHTAVFQLGDTKAPGPDGLNGLFYRAHWDIRIWLWLRTSFGTSGKLEIISSSVKRSQMPNELCS